MAVETDIIAAFGRNIITSMDSVLKALEGLDADQLNWKPPAPDTNSLYAIASHVLLNSQEYLLSILCGVPNDELPLGNVVREQAFQAQGQNINPLLAQWQILEPELVWQLSALPADTLTKEFQHPRRGPLTGLEIFLRITAHMAEHKGHAELTRDLVKAL